MSQSTVAILVLLVAFSPGIAAAIRSLTLMARRARNHSMAPPSKKRSVTETAVPVPVAEPPAVVVPPPTPVTPEPHDPRRCSNCDHGCTLVTGCRLGRELPALSVK